MYFLTSSAVIPIPLSMTVIVFASLSVITSTLYLLSSGAFHSPIPSNFLSLVIASQAFDTNSLKKISWSE